MAHCKKGLSPELRETQIDEILKRYYVDKETQHSIAASFGVNQGRISEVVNGHRFPEKHKAFQLSLPFLN